MAATPPPLPPAPRPAPGTGRRAFACAALLAGLLQAGGAAVAGIETQTLYSAPGWRVLLSHDSDGGRLWCLAETSNRRAQALHLVVLDDGRAGISVVDPRWSFDEGRFDLLVEIDRDSFRLVGLTSGSAITALPARPEAGRNLVAALAAAKTLALRDGLGGWIAGFGLAGIGPAAAALADCGAAIALPGALP